MNAGAFSFATNTVCQQNYATDTKGKNHYFRDQDCLSAFLRHCIDGLLERLTENMRESSGMHEYLDN